jgi:Ca-activated chloride channel family protein
MADDTGGKYYRATSGFKLDEVFSEIDKLEKTKLDVNKFTKYSEKFFPWLLTSLIVYLIGIFLENTIFRRAP